jgi:methionyl-tRNA formyltransferase
VPSLSALLASDVDVAAVVTNPDRRAGRGLDERQPPVKQRAVEAGIEVLQPHTARDPDLATRLEELAPDVATVVAYGRILPPDLLALPPLGFVNVHFSLLPRLRGAAPVPRVLLEGASETGVSIMVLTEGMDEGPVLVARPEPVDERDTAGSLGSRLARIGASLLVDALHGYADATLEPVPQDDAAATYAPKLSAEETRIDWRRPARDIRNQVRALNPEPGAWTTFDGRRLRVLEIELEAAGGALDLAPGELRLGKTLVAGTGEGAVIVHDAQAEGRRRMTGAELARGLRPAPGSRLR